MANPLREVADPSDKTDETVKFWLEEISLAKKRDRNFWEKAQRVVRLYEGEKHEDNSFNILYANTETLLPACYNQLPRPFVDRKFHDPDPLGKLSAKVLERTLTELSDSGDSDYDPFTKLLEQAVLGALIPGRGVTWFRYEAEFETQSKPLDNAEGEGEDAAPSGGPGDADPAGQVTGEKVLTLPTEKVSYETICGDDLDYDEFLCGYARRWVKVPWICRIHKMHREDATASFGRVWASRLKYNTDEHDAGSQWKKESGEAQDAQRGTQPTAVVYEIWNKDKKEVLFISPGYIYGPIKVVSDPLEISGFFPCPEPLRFLIKRSKLTPTPIYTLYEEQAKELNRATQRINRVLHALKVRGFYDNTIQGLKELLNADDNTLLPAKNVAAMQDIKSLDNAIWLMPLDMLVKVLHELWNGREQIKETIYEITGIADIMRGQGEASATATQERIKNQWGTLRLNRMQRYVQEYARACLRIWADIASKHFSLDTFAEITNLDFAKPADIKKAQKVMQQVQRFQIQAQMAPPQAGMPPAQAGPPGAPPPAGPQMPPQLAQMAQEAQAVLSKPPWEPIIALLRDDVQRYYRIDIETNSTIADNTQEDKQNITEAMTALGNMYSTFEAAVQSGIMPVKTLKALTLGIVRHFPFGREVEDEIAQMPDELPPQPPPPGQPTPEEIQAIQEKAKADTAKAQVDTVKAQAELQALGPNAELEQQKTKNEIAKLQREEEVAMADHVMSMEEKKARIQEIQVKLAAVKEEAAIKISAAQAQHVLKVAGNAEDLRNTAATNEENEKSAAIQRVSKGNPSKSNNPNSKLEDLLAQHIQETREHNRLLKSPLKARVASRDAKGKALDIHLVRD